jgi:beta-galactosidase
LKEADVWADEIIPTTALTIATYDDCWLSGKPAITVNRFGKGKVVYVGTVLTDDTLRAFVQWLCRLTGVSAVLQTPDGLRAYERRSDQTRLLFLLNFTDGPQPVALGEEWSDAFTGEPTSKVTIPPIDLRLLARDT